MSIHSPRAVLLFLAALMVALTVAMPTAEAASGDGSLTAVQERFVGRENLAWDTDLCVDTPVSYVKDVLLGVALSEAEVEVISETLAVGSTSSEPYGVTAFHLAAGDDAVEVRAAHPNVAAQLHLDHVFFFDPFLRYSPAVAPALLTGDHDVEPLATGVRPVAVIDTGYQLGAPDPEGYALAPGTRVAVNAGSPTAHHGPFIASQIASLVPGDITLHRVVSEQGWLLPDAEPGAEEIFDEVALLRTLDQADLTDAVVNMSFGTYGCEGFVEPRGLAEALDIERATANAVFIAAAGNDESSAQHYPAAFASGIAHDPMVISVGAYNGDPVNPLRSCFSNFGAVAVWAPGSGVIGRIPGPAHELPAKASGTSFAAPYVAAALSAGAHPHDAGFFLYPLVYDADGTRSSFGESACS